MKRKIHRSFLCLILTFSLLLLHLGTLIGDQRILSVGYQQNIRTVLITTQRGTIYDRNRIPLNNTGKQYYGVCVPELKQLNLLRDSMTEQEYTRLSRELKQQSLLIASLDRASYTGQKLRTFEVPQRYEDTVPCGHLLGYWDKSRQTGLTGIEKAYDVLLNQYSGKIAVTYQVNGIGQCQTDKSLKVSNTLSRCSGGVILTIDKQIQSIVDTLASRYISKGSVVILDAPTGEILACASLPDYHPEQVQTSIDHQDGALINRLLYGYDCGSVFKIVTTAAALEHGVSRTQTYLCPGELTVGDTTFHCHQRLGHQTLNMDQAFAQSCNLYFIQLAQEIGGDAILNTADQMGLYDPIELADGICASAALLPESSELYPATLANLSFGQGELLLSPLHVAQLTSVIANRGIKNTPTAVLGTVDESGNKRLIQKGRGEQVLTPTTATAIQWMMEQVVTNGTGVRAQPSNHTAAGKTGTAETGQVNGNLPVVQSWFTGYYPADNPQYIITILAEDAENNDSDTQAFFREICNLLD